MARYANVTFDFSDKIVVVTGGGSGIGLAITNAFALDEQAGVAYMTTHRENTIERVPLNPHSAQMIQTVAGIPFDQQLIGPSVFVWGRGRNDYGCVAYVTTDGGVTAPPPDGIVQPTKLLRADLCDDVRETLPSTTYYVF